MCVVWGEAEGEEHFEHGGDGREDSHLLWGFVKLKKKSLEFQMVWSSKKKKKGGGGCCAPSKSTPASNLLYFEIVFLS